MPAAEKEASLSGTWVLDVAHSKSSHTDPGIRKINVISTRGGVTLGGGEDPNGGNNDDGNVTPGESPAGGYIENLTLLIVQTDRELQVTRRFISAGQERTIPQKFALDGSQCLNLASDGRGEFESRTNWQGGKLINSGTETITIREPRAEISLKEEYSISKNGEKLTIKTTSTTPRGVTTLKQVFNKSQKPKP